MRIEENRAQDYEVFKFFLGGIWSHVVLLLPF